MKGCVSGGVHLNPGNHTLDSTVNKQVVHILLECLLVMMSMYNAT